METIRPSQIEIWSFMIPSPSFTSWNYSNIVDNAWRKENVQPEFMTYPQRLQYVDRCHQLYSISPCRKWQYDLKCFFCFHFWVIIWLVRAWGSLNIKLGSWCSKPGLLSWGLSEICGQGPVCQLQLWEVSQTPHTASSDAVHDGWFPKDQEAGRNTELPTGGITCLDKAKLTCGTVADWSLPLTALF